MHGVTAELLAFHVGAADASTPSTIAVLDLSRRCATAVTVPSDRVVEAVSLYRGPSVMLLTTSSGESAQGSAFLSRVPLESATWVPFQKALQVSGV